jgi:mono/diheme cytochrome c family protein
MKKYLIITGIVLTGILIVSCGGPRREPGRAYMPDMAYSTAYETYAPAQERLKQSGAYYSGQPVAGTMARGEMFPFPYKNDTSGYNQSASVKNPLPALNAKDYLEAARLYLVNCAICHGSKLDGQGPLFTSGAYIAAPKNFMADDMKTMAEGTMFHAVTYGKGQMGSYASQLTSKQRWMIIHYVKEKQSVAGAGTKAVTDTTGQPAGAIQASTTSAQAATDTATKN